MRRNVRKKNGIWKCQNVGLRHASNIREVEEESIASTYFSIRLNIFNDRQIIVTKSIRNPYELSISWRRVAPNSTSSLLLASGDAGFLSSGPRHLTDSLSK